MPFGKQGGKATAMVGKAVVGKAPGGKGTKGQIATPITPKGIKGNARKGK